eukprot:1057667-Rhodomonas_salina.3
MLVQGWLRIYPTLVPGRLRTYAEARAESVPSPLTGRTVVRKNPYWHTPATVPRRLREHALADS